MKLNRCTSEAGAGINAILLDTYSYGCEIIDLAYNHISPQSINVGLGNIFSSVYAITPGGRNDSAYYPDAVYVTNANITAGSGTGVTVNSTGQVMRQTYQVTVDYTALSAAALTSDKIIATLPAKTRIISIIADTTIKYLGGAVSAAALKIGSTVGGGEILASHDVYTAVITKGLADADMGTSLTRAAAIQGGAILSWTAATPIYVRMTTTTANTSALTQGSTTYYITTECF